MLARAAGAGDIGRAPAPPRTDTGAVTAETVMVLPLLAAVALALVWLLGLAGTHVRVVDAAREAARAAARDEPPAVVAGLGRRVAPAGAEIAVRDAGDEVVVDVDAEVRPAAGLLAFLPPVHVGARAVAAKEQP
jgi:hypothetical protein